MEWGMTLKIDQRSLSACGEVKSFGMIDVIKLVCALLVIVVHVPPMGNTSVPALQMVNYVTQQGIARIAVPFYFVCTGFLHFRRAGEGQQVLDASWAYVKKLLRLYLVWTVIYAPFILRDILLNPQGMLRGVVVALRDFLLVGSYVHLWYLHATMIAVLLVAFLLAKKVQPLRIVAYALVTYALGLMAQSWFGVIRPLEGTAVWQGLKLVQSVIATTRNGLFEGFIFVALGAVLARCPIRMSTKAASVGLAASLLLLAAEVALLTKLGWIREHDYYFSLIPVAFCMVLLVGRVRLDNTALCARLRTVASLIFFVHIWVRGALMLFSGALGLGWTENAMLFVLTVVISTALAVLIEALGRTRRFAFLKKLL